MHVVKGKELHGISQAGFLMASRNANNSGSALINPLKADNDEEKKIIAEGELRRQKRLEMRKSSVRQEKPTQEEHDIMYDLLEKTTDKTFIELYKRVLPADSRWMSDACDVTTILSFPENKNMYNAVFGDLIGMKNVIGNSPNAEQLTTLNTKMNGGNAVNDLNEVVPKSSLYISQDHQMDSLASEIIGKQSDVPLTPNGQPTTKGLDGKVPMLTKTVHNLNSQNLPFMLNSNVSYNNIEIMTSLKQNPYQQIPSNTYSSNNSNQENVIHLIKNVDEKFAA
uniref:Uncharacterized protein n=1 Tax=Glossina austeni TaxID=7395 RepID=A0A1A9UES6_GLOAU